MPFTFPQSQNSYFRKKGCVCLFDLRAATQEQTDEALPKFYFLNPRKGSNPVFLTLNQACYMRLIPWSASIAEEDLRSTVIPYVEAGYPGGVPLTLVDTPLWSRSEEGRLPKSSGDPAEGAYGTPTTESRCY